MDNFSLAASVLRMFLFAFGEETFMDGLRSYLDEKLVNNFIIWFFFQISSFLKHVLRRN